MVLRGRALRLLAAIAALTLAAGAAACGEEESLEVEEGEPVELGELEYNVLFSRFLNREDVEDRDYLEGQPPPGRGEIYLGVFLEVKNHGDEPVRLPGELVMRDTEKEEFVSIDSESAYALPLGNRVPAGDEIPIEDSTAAHGPIQGALVIFRITDQATENRPLEVLIPGAGEEARVILDI